MRHEFWTKVPGYQCRASSQGRVEGKTRVLRPFPDRNGYLRVTVRTDDGRERQVPVHLLVCLAFHGPRPSSAHTVAHRDGDRTRNVQSNLRWATMKEQMIDQARHGTLAVGERSGQAKLRAHQVIEIRQRHMTGEPAAALAARYGVSGRNIGNIVKRQSWRHLDDAR